MKPGLSARARCAGAALLFAAPLIGMNAEAQVRELRLESETRKNFARITARWADGGSLAPEIEVEVKGRVLVLRFSEPVRLAIKPVLEGLPDVVAKGRLDDDGRGARLALNLGVRVFRSTSVDRTAIDLVPENANFRPPPIVSPLVSRRAKPARITKPPPPELAVDMRVSTLRGMTRIAFHWNEPVRYEAGGGGQRLSLNFAARADLDTTRIRFSPPPAISAFDALNSPSGLVVTMTATEGYRVSHHRDGAVVVVSLAPNQPEKADTPELLRKKQPPLADQPRTSGPIAPRTTWLRGGWPSPIPGSGTIPVRVRAIGGGVEISVPWDKPVPAAFFTRSGVVWAVFGAEAEFKLDMANMPSGVSITPVDTERASVLRIGAPIDTTVSAMQSGPDWSIRLLASPVPAERRLSPQRLISDTGRPSIHTLLPGAAGLVWFRDPVVGDMLAAAVAFGPSSGLGLGRRLVEADLLASAHGMGIVPRADDISVSVSGETVIVSAPFGLAVSADDPAMTASLGRGARYINLEAWGGPSGEEFFAARSVLEQHLAAVHRGNRGGAESFLSLARFYVGHDLGVEALGVLRLAVAERPLIAKDARVLALRAVASIMAGRHSDGESLLSQGSLAADRTVALWRALAAAGEEKWRKAHDLFATGEEFLPVVVPRWAAVFHAVAAEAAYHSEDFDQARRYALLASASGYTAPFERSALVLARLSGEGGDRDEVYQRLGEVARMTSDPVAVDAELEHLELGAELKAIPAREIAERLEALRFRWRGDRRETRIVRALTDQYMALGRYREALAVAQAVNVHDSKGPGARSLRLAMSEYFRKLFLGDEANRLDPIKALALFYEFRFLTPIGADGDRMVRKLARRLVAFDLLDQAAELLQHQIDKRVRGPGRVTIAADLAGIYLLNRRFAEALKVIGATRSAASTPELTSIRRRLEARALVGLERYDHAVELMEGLTDFDASWIRSKALWHGGKWKDAAEALMVCAEAFTSDSSPKESGRSLSDIAMRAAVAARMASDTEALKTLRQRHISLFNGTEKARSFDLLTARTDASGVGLAEAVRILGDMDRVDAFAASIGVSPIQ